MSWVGRRLPRYEGPVLLCGDDRFTADLARGARVIRFVRSTVARGRILSVNARPGAQIITAADPHGVKAMCPRLLRPEYVPITQPILASKRVTHIGEPITALIAETALQADRGGAGGDRDYRGDASGQFRPGARAWRAAGS